MLRSLVAVLVGSLLTVVGYLLGSAVQVLVTIGIPLGASPRPPGAGGLAANLAVAALAAVAGGWTAARLARRDPVAHAVAIAVIVAGGALWGFGKPASQWPGWYPLAMAAVLAAGAVAGGLLQRG